MVLLPFIGAMETLKGDIIEILQEDEVLNTYEMYPTENVISFTMEQGELETDLDFVPDGIDFPCITVSLIKRKNAKDKDKCGGLLYQFTTPGKIIFWVSPEGDSSIPSLDTIGERIDRILRPEVDNLLPDYVKEYEFGEAYQTKYEVPVLKTIKTLAFMVMVEFEITYEVTR